MIICYECFYTKLIRVSNDKIYILMFDVIDKYKKNWFYFLQKNVATEDTGTTIF